MKRIAGVVLALGILAMAASALAMSSELLREEHRTGVGTIFIGPDSASGGGLSVWFTETATSEVFWINDLQGVETPLREFLESAHQSGRTVYIEGDFEWWGEGNVIWNIVNYGFQ